MLKDIQDGAASVGIQFNVQFDEKIHDRISHVQDNGWKVPRLDPVASGST